ncbi:MAG: hypothetical protein RLZZ165_1728 [Bacteroidota bacterium]|jgi:hypothetical protein
MMASCKTKDQDLESKKFIRLFGTDADEKAWDIVQTEDNGFAILCQQSDSIGLKALLIRTDPSGKLLWQLGYRMDSTKDAVMHDLIKLDDGTLLMAGYTVNPKTGAKDGLMVNVRDEDSGSVVWFRPYGIPPSDKELNHVVQLKNGQLVAVGEIKGGIWLLRTNGQGEVISEKSYKVGTGTKANSLVATNDRLIACGNNQDSILLAAWKQEDDSLVWMKTLLAGSGAEGVGIAIPKDSSKIVVIGNIRGKSGNTDIFLGTYTTDGDSISSSIYSPSGEDLAMCRSIPSMAGDSFLVVGSTTSFGRDQKDILVLKYNPSSQRKFEQENYGGRFDDVAISIIKLQDGTYAICGHTNSFAYNGKNDVFLMKLDGNGKLKLQEE